MSNRFLISVAAAALIAGTGLANAQGAMNREGGAGPAAKHSAPPAGSSSAQSAPQQRETAPPSPGMKNSAQAKEMMGKDRMDNAQSKDGMGKEGAKKKSAQSPDGMGKEGMKNRAQSKDGTGKDRMDNAQSKDGMSKDGMRNSAKDSKSTTTGNAATSARVAAPPPEKRTQIVSAIKSEKIKETNVNVNISIGTTLPTSVRFYPLPPRIVEIYPAWRGYEVVLIHGRYVIVRPKTREIVYIIES